MSVSRSAKAVNHQIDRLFRAVGTLGTTDGVQPVPGIRNSHKRNTATGLDHETGNSYIVLMCVKAARVDRPWNFSKGESF